MPAWRVDLYGYDVELFGTLCDGHFACGLLLGGEWRDTASPGRRQFGVAPFTEAAARPYLRGSRSPWYMPRLRPSTALLLLKLALELLLDPRRLGRHGGCDESVYTTRHVSSSER